MKATNYKNVIVDFVKDPPMYKTIDSWSQTWFIGQDDYKLRTLCATGNIKDALGVSPYLVLIKKQNESQVYKYEQFPLLWSILNNNYSYISVKDKSYIEDLLNAAPACGPYYFGTNDDGPWSSNNRLVCPENLHGTYKLGEYNGLDYMFLHNLFWLATICQYPKNIDYTPALYQSNSILATNQVTCSVPVDISNNSLEFIAGNSVKLLPGFSVVGSENENFTARAGSLSGTTFKKVSLTGYNSCDGYLGTKEVKKDNSTNDIESKASSNAFDQNKFANNFMNDINIFPNPADQKINIESKYNISISKIEIYNATNELVLSQTYQADHVSIDVSGLVNGIYFVRIIDENNQVYTKKIIKL